MLLLMYSMLFLKVRNRRLAEQSLRENNNNFILNQLFRFVKQLIFLNLLVDYILAEGPRDGILDENREGISSLQGKF